MTEIEKIRAKVKRRKDELHHLPFTDENLGKINAYEFVLKIIDSLSKEPVSEDLEGFAKEYSFNIPSDVFHNLPEEKQALWKREIENAIVVGANWQKKHRWKDAQGDDLPEIDREVIALQGRKVVFAHRPPEYWESKNIDTGEITRHYPQTYDKGGWNISGVTYWLDAPLPEGIE